MKKFLITTLVILSALMAQDMTGYEIMEKALNQSSWDDMQADMQLILKNVRGQKRIRKIAFYSSESENGLNHMLMRFIAPADVKGTGFLTLETMEDEEERYLIYRPYAGLRKSHPAAAAAISWPAILRTMILVCRNWKTFTINS